MAATKKYLFSQKLNSFARIGYIENGGVRLEEVVDASSLFGLWYFGMLDESDPLFVASETAVKNKLQSNTPIGGFIRYENDRYFSDTELSNPWFITTLWETQRMLKKPKLTEEEIQQVKDTLDWVISHAYDSGVLSEQLQPHTGMALSATPLVWSHSTYVETVLMFIKKLEELGLCPEC